MKLTAQDCRKLIGGLLGVLCSMADAEAVREAVSWWAVSDEGWKVMNNVSVAKSRRALTESEGDAE